MLGAIAGPGRTGGGGIQQTDLPTDQFDRRNVSDSNRVIEAFYLFPEPSGTVPDLGNVPDGPISIAPMTDFEQAFAYDRGSSFRTATISLMDFSMTHYDVPTGNPPPNDFAPFPDSLRLPISVSCPELQSLNNTTAIQRITQDSGQGLYASSAISWIGTLPAQLTFRIGVMNPTDFTSTRVYNPNYNIVPASPWYRNQYLRTVNIRWSITPHFTPNKVPVFGMLGQTGAQNAQLEAAAAQAQVGPSIQQALTARPAAVAAMMAQGLYVAERRAAERLGTGAPGPGAAGIAAPGSANIGTTNAAGTLALGLAGPVAAQAAGLTPSGTAPAAGGLVGSGQGGGRGGIARGRFGVPLPPTLGGGGGGRGRGGKKPGGKAGAASATAQPPEGPSTSSASPEAVSARRIELRGNAREWLRRLMGHGTSSGNPFGGAPMRAGGGGSGGGGGGYRRGGGSISVAAVSALPAPPPVSALPPAPALPPPPPPPQPEFVDRALPANRLYKEADEASTDAGGVSTNPDEDEYRMGAGLAAYIGKSRARELLHQASEQWHHNVRLGRETGSMAPLPSEGGESLARRDNTAMGLPPEGYIEADDPRHMDTDLGIAYEGLQAHHDYLTLAGAYEEHALDPRGLRKGFLAQLGAARDQAYERVKAIELKEKAKHAYDSTRAMHLQGDPLDEYGADARGRLAALAVLQADAPPPPPQAAPIEVETRDAPLSGSQISRLGHQNHEVTRQARLDREAKEAEDAARAASEAATVQAAPMVVDVGGPSATAPVTEIAVQTDPIEPTTVDLQHSATLRDVEASPIAQEVAAMIEEGPPPPSPVAQGPASEQGPPWNRSRFMPDPTVAWQFPKQWFQKEPPAPPRQLFPRAAPAPAAPLRFRPPPPPLPPPPPTLGPKMPVETAPSLPPPPPPVVSKPERVPKAASQRKGEKMVAPATRVLPESPPEPPDAEPLSQAQSAAVVEGAAAVASLFRVQAGGTATELPEKPSRLPEPRKAQPVKKRSDPTPTAAPAAATVPDMDLGGGGGGGGEEAEEEAADIIRAPHPMTGRRIGVKRPVGHLTSSEPREGDWLFGHARTVVPQGGAGSQGGEEGRYPLEHPGQRRIASAKQKKMGWPGGAAWKLPSGFFFNSPKLPLSAVQ